jgi:methylmalonyl-CoA mutase cobalamin-binding subunit
MPRLSEEGDPISNFAVRVLDVLVDRNRRTSTSLRHDLVVRLAACVAGRDGPGIDSTLRAFRRACISPATMADLYVPAAARLLGAEWLSDETGFCDVTIATARLQVLVRGIGTRWEGDAVHLPGRKTVLMLVPEGHDHTLGAVVAAGQLRRMDLSVCLRLAPTRRELTDLLRSRVFDAAMISVGDAGRLEVCRKLVETLRVFAPRPLPILAGGSALVEPEELKRRTGVDYVTSDLADAVAFCGLGRSYAEATAGTEPLRRHG